MPAMLDCFVAMKVRYDAQLAASGLNGFFLGKAWPNTNRPYLVGMPITDVPTGQTNKGRYADATVELHVMADDPDLVTRLAYLVQSAMIDTPLFFTGTRDRLMYLEEGDIIWQEQDQYWEATVSFVGRVAKPGRSVR